MRNYWNNIFTFLWIFYKAEKCLYEETNIGKKTIFHKLTALKIRLVIIRRSGNSGCLFPVWALSIQYTIMRSSTAEK